MKVCCGSGKPYDSLKGIERLGCSHYHCLGPIEVEEFNPEDMPILNLDTSVCIPYKRGDYEEIDLLTVCGTFDTNGCISHEDMRHLFSKPDSWQEWIASQIEQEGIEQYKQ